MREMALEQYKLYVEMADHTTERRSKANTFFMTLHTAFYGGMWAFLIKEFSELQKNPQAAMLALPLAVPFVLMGLLCICWWFAIRSYDQLIAKKFQVIGELEHALPAQPYTEEWKLLGHGMNWKVYYPLSQLDRTIPWTVGIFDILTALMVLRLLWNI